MVRSPSDEILELLVDYDRVVEVGIGRDTALAAALVERGVSVTATDLYERTVPAGVTFVVDDVTDPDYEIYADADAIVARRLPPELQRPAADVAREVDADLYFTTLGADPAIVPAAVQQTTHGPVFVVTRK